MYTHKQNIHAHKIVLKWVMLRIGKALGLASGDGGRKLVTQHVEGQRWDSQKRGWGWSKSGLSLEPR